MTSFRSVSGRPMALNSIIPHCDAILAAVQNASTSVLNWQTARALISDLGDVKVAINSLIQLPADIALYVNEQRQISATNIVYAGAQAMAARGYAAADAALAALSDTAAKVGSALDPAALARVSGGAAVSKPTGVSDAMVIERRRDMELVLRATAEDAGSGAMAYKNRLDKALDSRDMLTAYVLLNQMDIWLTEIAGISPDVLATAKAQSVGRASNPDGTPLDGAGLVTLLQGGGEGSLQGLITRTRHSVYLNQQSMASHLEQIRLSLVGK